MSAIKGFRPTIFIVETDEEARRLLYRAFRGAGFKVLLASSGQAAVKLYRGVQSSVVAVFVSAQRPVLNACRLLAALKQINPLVRCVVATELTPDDELLPLVRQGAAGLLAKPLIVKQAVAEVARVMESDWITPVSRAPRRRAGKPRCRSSSASL